MFGEGAIQYLHSMEEEEEEKKVGGKEGRKESRASEQASERAHQTNGRTKQYTNRLTVAKQIFSDYDSRARCIFGAFTLTPRPSPFP